MRAALPVLTIAVLLTATPGATVADPTIDAVKANYSYCTVCHGPHGNGDVAIAAPAIAGIEPWYLAEQLKAYRERLRGKDFEADPAGTEMRIVAGDLTDKQIAEVARYIGKLGIERKNPSLPGDPVNGKQLYAAQCAACHGAQADGNAALHAPALSRLNDWYIVASYKRYRSGVRGNSADNAPGNQMHQIAQALPEAFPINDVSAYLATLDPVKRK
jgi:cytochrome c oxidase subunit 2